jgi:predicted heme/steroid binding protein
MHKAGQDLTDALNDAPHQPSLLFRFPVVGELAETDEK